MLNQKGSSPVFILVVIVSVLILSGTIYYFQFQQKYPSQNTADITEQKALQADKTDSKLDWSNYTDPNGRFEFKYPPNWFFYPNDFLTPAGGLKLHSIGFFLSRNESPPIAKSITVGVYEGYQSLSAYDFLAKEWCHDGGVLEQEQCLEELKIHSNENGDFSIIESLSIIPGALGPAAWITQDNYGIFVLSNNMRYSNKEDLHLFNQILTTFKFIK
jgi:hypothetical protein